MTIRAMSFYATSVGKKTVMAVTGVLLVLFIVIHMLGNLQIFGGPQKMNAYAAFLHSIQGPLWVVRIVLGLAALAHVVTGMLLVLQGLRSRPSRYVRRQYQAATASSRTMLITGPLLLAYIVYHLLHHTFGTILPGFDPANVYGNVIRGFANSLSSTIYLTAMLMLALHVKHGLWSMFQSVGLNAPRYDASIRALGVLLMLAVVGGYVSIVVTVMAGLVQ